MGKQSYICSITFANLIVMMKDKDKDYILGANETELRRLKFQHDVWKDTTLKFWDKLGIEKGWKVLDAGSGPGFAAFDLGAIVGSTGEVTALEQSAVFIEYYKNECAVKKLDNCKFIHSSVENSALPENYYDLIFARWVIAFVPDADIFLDKLLKSLKPGGVIAFMDYAYEGLALYPRGGAFENMSESVKSYWRHGGGDPYIGARLPAMFRKRNLDMFIFDPVTIAGPPSSGIFQWADKFFTSHIQIMADHGIFSQTIGDEMLNDWIKHRNNPDSIFFSPMLVNTAARKPRT